MTPHVSVCYRPGEFVLPARYVGLVKPGRLASTPGDNLVEFGAKLCYDTLQVHPEGGRPSCDYHSHVLGQGHGSVAAHLVETFEATIIDPGYGFRLLAALVGRPGVWVTHVNDRIVRFAVSLRAVLEWDDHGVGSDLAAEVGESIQIGLGGRYPLTLAGCGPDTVTLQNRLVRRVDAQLPQEQWVSLYIEGISRDALGELVRHHYQANPSVRSTRYVDEGHSNQMLHPALENTDLAGMAAHHFDNARRVYRYAYAGLTAKGVDKKTARGAARSLLPGATETRMVFSLSRTQAKHILHLRADHGTGAVDPEVSRLATMMRNVLHAEGWTDV